MKKSMRRTTIWVFVTLILASCNKIQPAGFWDDFEKKLCIEQLNDQGPWGGHLVMFWKSDHQGTFNTKRIIDFANENGWTIVDSSTHSSAEVSTWRYTNKPIFPLTHEGFNSNVTSAIGTYEYFPRWTTADVLVLHFKTGWVSIHPGTNDTNGINGFVMINNNKDQMTVYHLWGE